MIESKHLPLTEERDVLTFNNLQCLYLSQSMNEFQAKVLWTKKDKNLREIVGDAIFHFLIESKTTKWLAREAAKGGQIWHGASHALDLLSNLCCPFPSFFPFPLGLLYYVDCPLLLLHPPLTSSSSSVSFSALFPRCSLCSLPSPVWCKSRVEIFRNLICEILLKKKKQQQQNLAVQNPRPEVGRRWQAAIKGI